MTKNKDRDQAELVEALAAPDVGVLAMAKSLLESAGIRYFVRNENVQNLFAYGQLGLGYNPIVGPPAVMVASKDAAAARELLAPLLQPSDAARDEPDC